MLYEVITHMTADPQQFLQRRSAPFGLPLLHPAEGGVEQDDGEDEDSVGVLPDRERNPSGDQQDVDQLV